MDTIKLLGHSGCRLEIRESGGAFTVNKTARDTAYNLRLKKQCEKQTTFMSVAFRAPAVLGSGYDSAGLFSFSMEYINGFTLAEHLKTINIASVPQLAKQLLSFIPSALSTASAAPSIFKEKIESLERQLSPAQRRHFKKALTLVRSSDWTRCSPGPCHGDLTLENIIWKDGELYLIDFLDSFYESPLMDIAKLLFDLECLWSYRNDAAADKNLETRLFILKDDLLKGLRLRRRGKELVHTIYMLALLHLLRILPYAQDDRTNALLEAGAQKLYTIIDGLS